MTVRRPPMAGAPRARKGPAALAAEGGRLMERTTARISGQPGPAAPTPITARLKAERIQELLSELPGWSAARNATEISRRYALSSPRAAVAFAHFVTETAADHGLTAELDLRPNRVVV